MLLQIQIGFVNVLIWWQSKDLREMRLFEEGDFDLRQIQKQNILNKVFFMDATISNTKSYEFWLLLFLLYFKNQYV